MRNKRRAREIEEQVNHTSAACTGLKIKPHALEQAGQQKSSTDPAMNYALEQYVGGKASISQLGQTANSFSQISRRQRWNARPAFLSHHLLLWSLWFHFS